MLDERPLELRFGLTPPIARRLAFGYVRRVAILSAGFVLQRSPAFSLRGVARSVDDEIAAHVVRSRPMVGSDRTHRRNSSASSKVARPSLRATSSLSLIALKNARSTPARGQRRPHRAICDHYNAGLCFFGLHGASL